MATLGQQLFYKQASMSQLHTRNTRVAMTHRARLKPKHELTSSCSNRHKHACTSYTLVEDHAYMHTVHTAHRAYCTPYIHAHRAWQFNNACACQMCSTSTLVPSASVRLNLPSASSMTSSFPAPPSSRCHPGACHAKVKAPADDMYVEWQAGGEALLAHSEWHAVIARLAARRHPCARGVLSR